MTERSIFTAALEKTDPAERSAYLDQACGGDAGLRQRIAQLLKRHNEPGSFLQQPAAVDAATGEFTPDPSGKGPTPPPALSEGPGSRIGPYKLLQGLGEGGMGAVFLAEQEQPVRRRVALKIIKAGMDSAQVVARFEQERQALALMDHPNIAKVLDAGQTASGRPFFVMELVKGIPLTRYCDQEHLTPKERLQLFIPVCQAVHHAHQKGIVHRDLKPSNILIALYDGRPVPKVIDFGVAKASSQKLTERTMFTEVGSIIGTLEYMAPEQAELNNLDIDTRADIYSLGVVLYELLTGSTPFTAKQLRNAAFTDMLQIIREVEPLKPSSKLSSSQELAGIAARRKLEPKRLMRLVHGDLDWIAMKCLEKDRGRRYESASGLAADIERFLRSEPVLAGPPSTAYKVSKFLRRNKGPVVAAALVLLMLLLGAAVSTWQAVRATQAERDALAAQGEAADQGKVATQQRDEARQANANLRKAQDELRTTLYLAQMNRIQNSWDVDNIVQVRNLLTQLKPKTGEKDLRGFEWYFWDRLSHSELRTVELGSRNPAAMWFSPDGSRLAAVLGETLAAPFASPSAKSEFRLWDTATGQELLRFELTVNFASKVAFSPDGQRLAANTNPLDAMVWNTATGKPVCTIKAGGELTMVVFAPDGKRLAGIFEPGGPVAKKPMELKIWDAATGELVAGTALSSDPAMRVTAKSQLTFTPDGKRVAVVVEALQDKDLDVVRFWEVDTGKEVANVPVASDPNEGTLVSPSVLPAKMSFSPDGKTFALPICMFGTKPADDVQFSFLEMMRMMSSATGGVRMWDLESGKQLRTIKGLRANSASVFFSPNGKQLMALDATSGDVRVWDAATGQEQFNIINNPGRGGALSSGDPKGIGSQRTLVEMGVVYSPDGKYFAVTGYGTTVRVWDAATGELRLNFLGHTATVTNVAFSHDQATIYSAGMDGDMKAWDASAGRKLPQLTGNLFLSPDGRRAAELILLEPTAKPADPSEKVVPGQALRMWDTAVWKELYTLKRSGPGNYIGSLCFSQDGRRLAAISTDMPPQLGMLGGPMQDFMRIIMAKEGKEQKDSEVRILDAATGRELSSFKAALGTLPKLTFSPNGKWLASCPLGTKEPPSIKIWDAQTGKEVRSIPANTPPGGLAFSSDSKRLAGIVTAVALAKRSKEASTEIKFWDVESGKEDGALQVAGNVSAMPTFSPDGRYLATVHMSEHALFGLDSDGISFVRIWDVATGKERTVLKGTNRIIQVVAFSPDGSRIATAGMDFGPGQPGNDVKVWDTLTGAELLSLKTDILIPSYLAFSPSGDRLMVTGQVGVAMGASVVQIWDATPRPDHEGAAHK